MSVALGYRLLQAALIAAPLALGVGGCETLDKLNPFQEKQKPLPGERRPLFPEGVPGVEFGAPPQQPTNSNIPIAPSTVDQQQQSQEQPPQTATAPRPTPQPAQKSSKPKAGDPNDAWSGTR